MKALFFILLLFIQPSALASWTTGNKLNGDLNAEALEFYRGGFAMGFISAIASRESDSTLDILEGLENILGDKSINQSEKRERFLAMFDIVKKHTACIPSSVTQGQLEAIVKKWLALNPARWNESAAVLVKEALIDGFPCNTMNDLLKQPPFKNDSFAYCLPIICSLNTDGDTITVLQGREQVKVRLVEIDAPEKGQAFSNRSKQSLSDMCFDKEAQVQDKGKDRYGRTLGQVNCGGVDANAEQVKQGMAWVYDKYVTDHSLYRFQDEAKATKRGFWADANPMPPWEWRHKR